MTHSIRPVAIVTGGWRGIGFGVAKALAGAGYDVAITGLGAPNGASEALGELRQSSAKINYYESDLANLERHSATVAHIQSDFGRIDCLVNNAGIASVERGDFLDLKPDHFDTIMGINLRGTVFFTQCVVKKMLANEAKLFSPSIINITSVSAELSSPERLDYCISKAGLSAFSKGLALRLAEQSIAVFEVRPGIIRTDMTAGVSAKYDALIAGGLVPMKRWGEASEIGGICASLASGHFNFATGSTIDVDGGLSIARL